MVRQWALEGRGIAYKSELDVAGDRATASAGIRRLATHLAERCAALVRR